MAISKWRREVKKADEVISQVVKARDNWTCQRCQKKYPKESRSLHCSHYFGRRMFSVRWDLDNLDSLCFACHRYWEKEDREGYRDFKIKQLGKKRFEELKIKAYQKIKSVKPSNVLNHVHNLQKRLL